MASQIYWAWDCQSCAAPLPGLFPGSLGGPFPGSVPAPKGDFTAAIPCPACRAPAAYGLLHLPPTDPRFPGRRVRAPR
ncbi:MAG: hypothetical protein LC623_06315 [Halobacteriales archaeon]|nr:hypothetical protein [Halobacteriales archaeon]